MKVFIVVLIALVAMASARPHLSLFEHPHFRGHRHNIHGPQPWVGGFNDKASSFHAIRGNWDCFEHGHFKGRRLRMPQGARRPGMPGGWNDVISSCRPH
eukprot:sb/3478647/